MDNGGNNDGDNGSVTTAPRQRNDNSNKGGRDGDGNGGRDGCADDHVVLSGFASSRNSDRRFHTVPLTYGKGKYRPPQSKQNC